jgi:hypothetical protein
LILSVCKTHYKPFISLGMRVEWAEGRARRDRWAEELLLRPEEMRRSVATLLHEANAWDSRKDKRKDVSFSIQRGLNAFASRQAAIREGLARSFYALWSPALEKLEIAIEWPQLLKNAALTRSTAGVVEDDAVAAIDPVRADIRDHVEEDLANSGGLIAARDDELNGGRNDSEEALRAEDERAGTDKSDSDTDNEFE